MKIIGIYLAAGKSKRMGTDKRKLPFGGIPLGSIALKEALSSKLDHILIVTKTGDKLDWLEASCFLDPHKKRWSQVECPEAERGLGRSLACGVKKASDLGAAAIVVLLADQPFITLSIIDSLIDSYIQDQVSFVASEGLEGMPMPPILFSNFCYPHFELLAGDRGLRDLIRGDFFTQGRTIHFQDPFLFYDIDTPEDLRCLPGN